MRETTNGSSNRFDIIKDNEDREKWKQTLMQLLTKIRNVNLSMNK